MSTKRDELRIGRAFTDTPGSSVRRGLLTQTVPCCAEGVDLSGKSISLQESVNGGAVDEPGDITLEDAIHDPGNVVVFIDDSGTPGTPSPHIVRDFAVRAAVIGRPLGYAQVTTRIGRLNLIEH